MGTYTQLNLAGVHDIESGGFSLVDHKQVGNVAVIGDAKFSQAQCFGDSLAHYSVSPWLPADRDAEYESHYIVRPIQEVFSGTYLGSLAYNHDYVPFHS